MGAEMSGGPGALETEQLVEGRQNRMLWGDIESTPDKDRLGQARAPIHPLDCPAFKASLSEMQSNLIQANGDDPQLKVLYEEWIQARANYLVSADAMASNVIKMNRLSLEMSHRLEEIDDQDLAQERKRAKVEASPRNSLEPTSPAKIEESPRTSLEPTSPASPSPAERGVSPPSVTPPADAGRRAHSPSGLNSESESSPFDQRRKREPEQEVSDTRRKHEVEEEVSGLIPDECSKGLEWRRRGSWGSAASAEAI